MEISQPWIYWNLQREPLFVSGLQTAGTKDKGQAGVAVTTVPVFLAQVDGCLRAGGTKTGMSSPKTAPPPSLSAPRCGQPGKAASSSRVILLSFSGRPKLVVLRLATSFGPATGSHNRTAALGAVGFAEGCGVAAGSEPPSPPRFRQGFGQGLAAAGKGVENTPWRELLCTAVRIVSAAKPRNDWQQPALGYGILIIYSCNLNVLEVHVSLSTGATAPYKSLKIF